MRVRAAASAPSMSVGAARLTPGRYGEDRGPNLPAAALASLLAAGLLAALLHTGYHRAEVEAARLAVVNLSIAPPPPPPPSPPQETPPQQKAPVFAPLPLVEVPNNQPAMLTSPDPVPAPPVPVPAPLAPPAPPAAVQANDLGTRMVAGAPPRYPTESRRHREEGTVMLALTLDLDGSVTAISVAHSSGFQRLDEAALRAVRKWRWAPTMRNGQAVKVKGLVEIPFVLRG